MRKLKNEVLRGNGLTNDPVAKDLKDLFVKFEKQFEDHLQTIKTHRNTWWAHFGKEHVQETNGIPQEAESTTIRDMLIMSNETIVLIHRLMCANSKPRG